MIHCEQLVKIYKRPSAGQLTVDGKDLLKMGEKEIVRYKRETVGFVWQNNARNLVPYLTAIDNVELPMLIKGNHRRKRAEELLDEVGLSHRVNNKLTELSGGEQQRMAIAIALANEPKLLLADEPTGSVDTATASKIMDIFKRLNKDTGLTVVIVTHDPMFAKKVNRVVAIRDGKTSTEFLRKPLDLDRMEPPPGWEASEDLEEYSVMDQAGRVQIPEYFMEELKWQNKNKVKVEMVDGKIMLSPPK